MVLKKMPVLQPNTKYKALAGFKNTSKYESKRLSADCRKQHYEITLWHKGVVWWGRDVNKSPKWQVCLSCTLGNISAPLLKTPQLSSFCFSNLPHILRLLASLECKLPDVDDSWEAHSSDFLSFSSSPSPYRGMCAAFLALLWWNKIKIATATP